MKPFFAKASVTTTQRSSPDPTKTAATDEHRSERSEQSKHSARCASGYGPLRERRRAPVRSAGAVSETRFSSREARRTTHLPAPVRERNA
jgi:hypothetical protein